MSWDLTEAINYYRRQGAPGDQLALKNLLSEIQREQGGSIPAGMLRVAAEGLGVKESFLSALVRRSPSLRLSNVHVVEVCAGPNCSRKARLDELARQCEGIVEVRRVSCMRLCGKGPNIRFDGKLYHNADERLLARLIDGIDK